MPLIRHHQEKWFAILIAFLCWPGLVNAHDPGLSSVVVRVERDGIEAAIRVNESDLRGSLEPTALRVTVDGRELVPDRVAPLSVVAGERGLQLRYRTERPSHLTITSDLLPRLPYDHRQYARVEGSTGGLLAESLLTREHPSLEVALAADAGGNPHRAASGFVFLGIEHILEGYDHLLFLFALLVGCSGWRAALRIITGFTVGHSVTLAAATLGWVDVSPGIVEPVIAGSIVYVALLNLKGSVREGGERLAVAFGFGLIHGLGFAGALTDLGVTAEAGAVVIPLLAFNGGVELGQLAVAASSLPVIIALRRYPFVSRRALPACSALAAAFGFRWLIERTLLA